MDVSDASYYIQENKENKGSQMGHTKKIFKKTTKMFYSLFSEFGFFIIQIHFGYKGLWGRIYSCIFGRKNMFLEGKNPKKNPRSSYSFGKGKSQIKICICWCPLATIWHWSLMTKNRVFLWRWISLLKQFPLLVVNE